MSGQTPNVFDVKRAPLKQVTLVEASAGTGKTFSIKHLVLRLIVEENIPVDKILVMTFTVAATAELKHRIEEHLRAVRMLLLLDEKARAGGDKLLLDQIALWKGNPQIGEESLILKRVERSLALLDRANILTIHQSVPVNGIASLSLSIDVFPATGNVEDMRNSIESVQGIHYAKILARE